nr:MAG TPA: hypothetical protein [Caudoviricetes sp.]
MHFKIACDSGTPLTKRGASETRLPGLMAVMPRQTIKRFLHFALCLAGVGRSIFPVSRVCFAV